MTDPAEVLADELLEMFIGLDWPQGRERVLALIRKHYPPAKKPNCCCSTCMQEHYSSEVAEQERLERRSKKPPKRKPGKALGAACPTIDLTGKRGKK